ncbi:nucleotidyltransferase domain-containing protein [Paenarthrobacter sp. NPDC057981]|uniref:nucleotidyltransferase domain-containing protein n=1 Tax=Paenarthrobacter sp. NPDC057981 TaxID=3346297 RepID=UPI0036D8A97F
MRLQNPLSAISPTLDMGVLFVLARADAEFTAPTINALLPEGGSLAGVRKALGRLVEQGIVADKVAGRTHMYSLNREHLLAEAVLGLASARDRLSERIRLAIDLWEFSPTVVTIFGSAARKDMRTDSDIDLFVGLSDETDDVVAETCVADLAGKVSIWTGNDARPLVYRASEIAPAPIFDSIVTEGLTVYGDTNWLGRRLREAKAAS